MTKTHWHTLRIATYNVHRCLRFDGRTNSAHIAAVIHSVKADVIALQEIIGGGKTSQATPRNSEPTSA